MKLMRYVGRSRELVGLKALTREVSGRPDKLFAQFNFPERQRGNKPWKDPHSHRLSYGWHLFGRDQFEDIPAARPEYEPPNP